MRYFKRFVDEEEIKEVDRDEVVYRLGGFYKQPEEAIDTLPVGQKIRTHWAYFWKEDL